MATKSQTSKTKTTAPKPVDDPINSAPNLEPTDLLADDPDVIQDDADQLANLLHITNLDRWLRQVNNEGYYHYSIATPYANTNNPGKGQTVWASRITDTPDNAIAYLHNNLGLYKGTMILRATKVAWDSYKTNRDREQDNPKRVFVVCPQIVRTLNIIGKGRNAPLNQDQDQPIGYERLLQAELRNKELEAQIANLKQQRNQRPPSPMDMLITALTPTIAGLVQKMAAPAVVVGNPGANQPVTSNQGQTVPGDNADVNLPDGISGNPDAGDVMVQMQVPQRLYDALIKWDQVDTKNDVSELIGLIANLAETNPGVYEMAVGFVYSNQSE